MADPIPEVLLARLALCRSAEGQGIAPALLANAFKHVLMASGALLLIRFCHALATNPFEHLQDSQTIQE